MKKLLPALFILLCGPLYGQLTVTEHTLSNGMRVWLNEDHSQPRVAGAVVVNAGAKDCPQSGIAHYFEHIMFKGTDKIGTTDYAAEKVILDSIAAQYDLLCATQDAAERRRIQTVINGMSVRAARYAIPNDYNSLVSRYGGSRVNAYTSPDQTVYYNTFAPGYFEQWAALASERMFNPVFRLFQSELETVYEEKNMRDNDPISRAMEVGYELFFAPHPYAYPVIGTAESLKNPQPSQMEAFFRKYYVGSNMGVILCGDFDSRQVLPVLEREFSRLPAGTVEKEDYPAPRPISGRETYRIKIPIPVVKGVGLFWRGAGEAHEDFFPLEVMTGLLCNQNKTGLLDRQAVEGKLMEGMAFSGGLMEHGYIVFAAIPKLLGGSEKRAVKTLDAMAARLKAGDFSDELFESVKLGVRRDAERRIEEIEGRMRMLMENFTYGVSMDDYMARLDRLRTLTKDDVVALADKYLTADCALATKKTGKYPADVVPKPGFAPIVPGGKGARSEFALQLEKMPLPQPAIRVIDLDKDAGRRQLSPLVALYTKHNPVNDIFTVDLIYRCGEREDPNLAQAAVYLRYLGTDSLPFGQLRSRLQNLGASMDFTSSPTQFTLSVSGFDANFGPTMELVAHFLHRVRADPRQLKKVRDDAKMVRKTQTNDNGTIALALEEMVMYGKQSAYLSRNSVAEASKLDGGQLLSSLRGALRSQCDIHYCGTLDAEAVAAAVRGAVNPGQATRPGDPRMIYRTPRHYDAPSVHLVDRPKSTQAIIYAFLPSDALSGPDERDVAAFYNQYFGGGMSSILFQEIREFRSFAYGVNARFIYPGPVSGDKPCYLIGMMSTQNDKAAEAIGVFDSLLRHMPRTPERLDDARQSSANAINNAYPDFRTLSQRIAAIRYQGYPADPDAAYLAALPGMDLTDLAAFHERNIAARPILYMIVGDSKKIDMQSLEKIAPVIRVGVSKLFRQGPTPGPLLRLCAPPRARRC